MRSKDQDLRRQQSGDGLCFQIPAPDVVPELAMKTNDNRMGRARNLGGGSAGRRGDIIAAQSRRQRSRGAVLRRQGLMPPARDGSKIPTSRERISVGAHPLRFPIPFRRLLPLLPAMRFSRSAGRKALFCSAP